MSHQATRDFICDIAKSLRDDLKFGYGRTSDFNQIKDKRYPYVWLDPLTASLSTIENGFAWLESYNVNMFFYRFDEQDGTEKKTQDILDETDKLVQSFIRKLNEDLWNDFNDNLIHTHNTVISGASKQPVIKVTADILTGWTLSLTLTVPDTFDYCSLYT